VTKKDKYTQSDEHNARGIELADRGWFEEAQKEFNKAIALDPDSAHAYDNLATLHAESGELLEALQTFLTALQCEPDNPETHHYLANFLASHGQELAIHQYREAIQLSEHCPDSHLNLAVALTDAGRPTEALSELLLAHTAAPDDELIEHELACCLIDLDRLPEAITHLRKIIQKSPHLVEAYVDLGIAYTAQGFFAEAEEILRTALELDPNDFATHYHLATLYLKWNQVPRSISHLEQASRSNHQKLQIWLPDDPIFLSLHQDPEYCHLLDS